MAIALAFIYPLTHIVFFAGIVAEFIQINYPEGNVLKLYGPFLITFQIYALFVNHEFFLAEFTGRTGYYSQPAILAIETILHAVFMLFYIRLAAKIIERPPRFWNTWIAVIAALVPLAALAAFLLPGPGAGRFVPEPSAVRLCSVLSTSSILLYSAVYFLLYRGGVESPKCAKPMMLFTAIGNFAFVALFVPAQLLKMGKAALPVYVAPENAYLLAVGLANIIYDAPQVLLKRSEAARIAAGSVLDEAGLRGRERDIALRIERGMANKQIAAELGLREATVRNYIHGMFKRFGVSNRVQLMVAIKGGSAGPRGKADRS